MRESEKSLVAHTYFYFYFQLKNGVNPKNLREQPRRVDGHNYPTQRKRRRVEETSIAASLTLVPSSDEEDESEIVRNIENIDTDLLSSDEWTDSDSDWTFMTLMFLVYLPNTVI